MVYSSLLQDRDAYPAMSISMSRQGRLETLPTSRLDNIVHAKSLAPQSFLVESLPDSQESFVSTSTSSLAAPRLLSSSSNISNSTGLDTELTSPASSNGPSSQRPIFDANHAPTAPPIHTLPQFERPTVLKVNTDLKDESSTHVRGLATSPVSINMPVLAQGPKRTASGTVKSVSTDSAGSPRRMTMMGHRRNASLDSNAGKIGELSAQLKARLSYAMVKVQNGWEKRSIEELEEAQSQRASPATSSAASDMHRLTFESPRTSERKRRPSGVSDNSDQYLASPCQDSPHDRMRPLNGIPSPLWRTASSSQLAVQSNATANCSAEVSCTPSLAPAADIVPRSKRRSISTRVPPALMPTAQRKHHSDLGPRTPTTAAPTAGILRMPSQQAEKDAVDTLLFMSSPNNSSRLPHVSADAQPSPLRSELSGPRRVVFENDVSENKISQGAQHLLDSDDEEPSVQPFRRQ